MTLAGFGGKCKPGRVTTRDVRERIASRGAGALVGVTGQSDGRRRQDWCGQQAGAVLGAELRVKRFFRADLVHWCPALGRLRQEYWREFEARFGTS